MTTTTTQNVSNPQSKAFAESLTSEIPLEIHQMIIGVVANEAAIVRKPSSVFLDGPKTIWEETLSSCALVCRNWHNHALRERFRKIDINMDNDMKNDTGRLLELMQREPLMAPSVRHLSVHGSHNTCKYNLLIIQRCMRY